MKKNKNQNTSAEELKDPAATENPTPENSSPENQWEAVEEKGAEPELSELDQLKKQLAEQQEKYLYLQAEYQNFRKRSARDISDARSHAVTDTVMPFLSVADFLAMAQVAAEKTDNLDAIKQGLMMIIAQFDKALEEMSIRKFSSVGEDFDPDLHDAVGKEPSVDVPEGKIIREWNCGYKIGEKLLRPARVMVSSGPDAGENANESKE